ncbi:hypothetical protein Tco_0977723 [Tanacetum coccineum]|uniref:Uncharacterized protein n=1 Tax=Tanacetum coccineum TaxID=301880 RepID=A0ABQ5EKX9_9ASTR
MFMALGQGDGRATRSIDLKVIGGGCEILGGSMLFDNGGSSLTGCDRAGGDMGACGTGVSCGVAYGGGDGRAWVVT